MTAKIDFKKDKKEGYQAKAKPEIITLPTKPFIMVNGKGNPNTSVDYQKAIELLYALSYTIKMSDKQNDAPAGYVDYVVAPLESLWWSTDEQFSVNQLDKDKLTWTAMIRQPDFVTSEVFDDAVSTVRQKKPDLEVSLARLETFTEDLCAQILHIGSYDDEPKTIQIMTDFVEQSGYTSDLSETRQHHEIYLSDPRKTAPEKLKTIIRHPIKER